MSLNHLLSVQNAIGRSLIIEEDIIRLDASFAFGRRPTPVAGVPNTLVGPPTTGTYPQYDLFSDSVGGLWRCTVAGTPGTWMQVEPGHGTAFPGGPVVNYRFTRSDQNWKAYYWDGAAWQAVFSTPADTALMIPLTQKAAANGVATLDSGGKVPSAQLPAIAITNTSVVASQVAMLALTAETGDVAVRTDLNKSFILAGTDPTNLSHWQELLTPTDTVLSVNGFTGTVVLTTSNIAEGSNLYYTDVRADARITAAKNIANGIAGLDAGSRIAKAQGQSATVYNDQANAFTAGNKQSFTSDATNAGVRHVGVTASPASLAAGDVWFRTDTKVFSFYDGSATQTVCQGNDARLLTNLEPTQRMFRSSLDNMGTALVLVSATAYFVYLGRVAQDVVPKFVEFFMSAIGAGGQTAEVGFFSTPNAPSKAAQSLTKLVSTATVDTLSATVGVKRNTSAFATTVTKGTHLWAGIRTAMATTQPTIAGICMDMSQGHILALAGAGALTGAGPFAGAIVAIGSYFTSAQVPDLRAVLD